MSIWVAGCSHLVLVGLLVLPGTVLAALHLHPVSTGQHQCEAMTKQNVVSRRTLLWAGSNVVDFLFYAGKTKLRVVVGGALRRASLACVLRHTPPLFVVHGNRTGQVARSSLTGAVSASAAGCS